MGEAPLEAGRSTVCSLLAVAPVTPTQESPVADNVPLEEIGREVRNIIASALKRPVEQVPLTASLERSLGIDSMAMIEINIALEERFRFAMPDMASPAEANLKTVEDLARFVAAQLAGQKGGRS
jgi:acyl carrier protein